MKTKMLVVMMIFLVIVSVCVSQEISDMEIEAQAQKDLAAFIQYSAMYRFSSDLKVGDKVVYKVIDEAKEIFDLEVTKQTDKGLYIVEHYDGNEIHYVYDPVSQQIIEFWGFDENGERQTPNILTKEEVDFTISQIKTDNNLKKNLIHFSTNRNVDIEIGSFSCTRIEADVSGENFSKEQINSLKEQTTIYFSNNIPKLLPFAISMFIIGNESVYEKINSGCLKSSIIELIEYRKEN